MRSFPVEPEHVLTIRVNTPSLFNRADNFPPNVEMGIHGVQDFAYAPSKVAENSKMIIMVRNNELRAATVPNGTPNCHKLGSWSGLPSAREGCTETLKDPWFMKVLLLPDFARLVTTNALTEFRAPVEGFRMLRHPHSGLEGSGVSSMSRWESCSWSSI